MDYIDYFNVLSRIFDYNINVKLSVYIFVYRLPFLVESYYYEQVAFSVLFIYEILEIFQIFSSPFSGFGCWGFS